MISTGGQAHLWITKTVAVEPSLIQENGVSPIHYTNASKSPVQLLKDTRTKEELFMVDGQTIAIIVSILMVTIVALQVGFEIGSHKK